MNAPISSRLGWPSWLVGALAACIAMAGFLVLAGQADAAKKKTVQTLNLCVVKKGPDKGVVHFAGKAKCKKGEQLIQVVSGTGASFGLNESSGEPGAAGPAGATGPAGPEGARGPQGERGENGTNGTNGADGTDGTSGVNGADGIDGNSILNGTGAPQDAVGSNGDFYIDVVAGKIYGPKAAGQWPAEGVSLIGPAGADGQNGQDGADGQNGADGSDGQDGTDGVDGNSILSGEGAPEGSAGKNGDFYLDTLTVTLYGPKAAGAWPAEGVSLVGKDGQDGVDGQNGQDGVDGQNGQDGKDGADGQNGIDGKDGEDGKTILNGVGAPEDSVGKDGDFYINVLGSTIYGPKAAGAWPAEGVSLVGKDGQDGSDGQNGIDGKDGIDGQNGVDGKDGSDGQDGVDGEDGNTILSGSGAPDDGVGMDGDFYLDTTSIVLYGPKAGGEWPTEGTSLLGKDGADGQDGKDGQDGTDGIDGQDGKDGLSLLSGTGLPTAELGRDGEFYIDTTDYTIYGKQSGAWDAGTSLVGPQGPPGQDGTDGTDGTDGVDGKDGEDGQDGAPGDKGDKGDTGATGPAGLSEAFAGELSSATDLNTSSPSPTAIATASYSPSTSAKVVANGVVRVVNTNKGSRTVTCGLYRGASSPAGTLVGSTLSVSAAQNEPTIIPLTGSWTVSAGTGHATIRCFASGDSVSATVGSLTGVLAAV